MSSINVELVSRYLTKERNTPAVEFHVSVPIVHEYLGEMTLTTRWKAIQINGKFSMIYPTAKFDIMPDGKMVAVVQLEVEKALKKTKYESLPVKVWGGKDPAPKTMTAAGKKFMDSVSDVE